MKTELAPPFAAASGQRNAWRAVVARDTRKDGAFVYGVRSTYVYCRPSCPSRRPLCKNVMFFAGPGEAERAGFRACRRCLPRAPMSPTTATVEAVRVYLDEHAGDAVTLAKLAGELGVSATHLQRTFKKVTGVSPKHYLEGRRAEGFKTILKRGGRVTTAIYEAGYRSSSRAYERSHAHLGMTPAVYRNGGRGIRIRFAIARAPYGFVLVGATDRGICRVAVATSPGELRRALGAEFPHATIEQRDRELVPLVAKILAVVEGSQEPVLLPTDVRASVFQRRVWAALQQIPRGQTRSYSEIARSLGAPKAARAVGRACGSNPLALLVPCHRVVREDGDLGGYRWGLAVKRRLLATEKK